MEKPVKALNIHIVEDERIVALDIKNQLIAMGYKVNGVSSSGEDCLQDIQTSFPDLFLMDINLAGEWSGIETAKRVNAVKNVPIIFLTAYADQATLEDVKQSGIFGYVTKPFKQVDLKTEIEFTIDRFTKLMDLKKDRDNTVSNLEETEAFFKQVVDSVSDIIYRIDLKGFFTFVNSSGINQIGYAWEELKNMRYTNIIRKDYKHKAYVFFKNCYLNLEENSYFEFPILTKKGNEIWIGQNIHLVMSNKKIVGVQAVARDVTQEKIVKEQLIIAKRNAENTANMKSQFLANMSHEIRTPLNGIIGLVHLLSASNLSDKQQHYLQAISTSSNQLMGIINDVLDLSKIEAGKMSVELSEFDLHELVESVIHAFELKSSEKNVELVFSIEADVPKLVVGDAIHLNQILFNLVGNAMKFTENGKVILAVSLLEKGADSFRIQFLLKDTGIGMKEEVLESIFDNFTQAENETSRKFGGTGLGLAIVKKLVELQGGSIQVKSKLGKGSVFVIGLNFRKPTKNSLSRISIADQMRDCSSLTGKRILVVEDNPINQLVTKDLLEEQGVFVAVAENGRIALDVLLAEKFDLIVMDMQMPILDGYQTMRLIRESPTNWLREIPILALTANAVQTEMDKCFHYGANDYLSKPFKPDVLYTKIIQLLQQKLGHFGAEEVLSEELNLHTLQLFTNSKSYLLQMTLDQLSVSFHEDLLGLQSARLAMDETELKRIAHKIKPNFLLLGMEKSGKLCKEIEFGKSGSIFQENAKYLEQIIPNVLGQISRLKEVKKLPDL